MDASKALLEVQRKLKAPKGQYNSFGKYKYRSAEDILEAAKPLLAEVGLTLTLSDEVVMIGERYYVKAKASLSYEGQPYAFVMAYAREDETKKGMDGAQITGTASSYARKYALNGLFLIDDTKDADTDEYQKQTEERKPAQKPKMASKPARDDDMPVYSAPPRAVIDEQQWQTFQTQFKKAVERTGLDRNELWKQLRQENGFTPSAQMPQDAYEIAVNWLIAR